jgi:hypothetical protein
MLSLAIAVFAPAADVHGDSRLLMGIVGMMFLVPGSIATLYFARHAFDRVHSQPPQPAASLTGNPAHHSLRSNESNRAPLCRSLRHWIQRLRRRARDHRRTDAMTQNHAHAGRAVRAGGALQPGSMREVKGPGKVPLGQPPADAGEDWVALVR